MKLKFYMRGIGIGMLVTAAILKLSNISNGSEMSDEQIKARAKQLGMIENTVLKSTSDNELSAESDIKDEGSAEVIDLSTSTNIIIDNNVTDSNVSSSTSVNILSNTEDSKVDNEVDVSMEDDNKDNKLSEKDADKISDKDADKSIDEDTDKDANKEVSSSSSNNEKENDSLVTNSNSSITISVVKGDSSFSVAKKVVAAGLATSAADFDQFLCENNYDKTLSVGNHKIPSNASYDEIGKILTSKEN